MRDQDSGDEGVNILLVDDRPSNLLSLKGALDRPDYNIVLAHSGEEALRAVLKQEFAVILLDVAMPQMDGFEVARLLKQRIGSRTIPIIFVTASVQNVEWIFRAYNIGAVDFLHKPLDAHAVRAKVSVFVELFRHKASSERQSELLRASERRERELELDRIQHESERHYRNLAEAIPHVVWTAAPDGSLEYFNRRWSEITGLSDEQSLGPHWRQAIHPEDLPEIEERWRGAASSETSFVVECRVQTADGPYRWFLCRGLPERDAAHDVVRWLGTFTDIDEERRARDEARAAVALRDEFMSIASHELRTPLTALRLQLESLVRLFGKLSLENVDERLVKKVSGAIRQTDRLSLLVDNLLDVSRITGGRLVLHLESFDLAEVARDVAERFREEFARGGSELRVGVHGPVVGAWDRLRIEQVFTNLLSNALKYASEKPIDLSIESVDGWARLSVCDQGIGIEPEHLERIFGRFERAASARNYGGLGLGLYIVRQIVDAHGGRIQVSSEPSQGTRFIIELPLQPVADRELEAGAPTQM